MMNARHPLNLIQMDALKAHRLILKMFVDSAHEMSLVGNRPVWFISASHGKLI